MVIKAGVVGGTGYTGVELLRLLARHPSVELAAVTSRAEAGRRVDDLYPNLRGHVDHCFSVPDTETLAACDLVFFATPNGVAMKQVPELLERGVRVIDLAADFRIKDIPTWEKWYGMNHACPELVAEAVYGLPELNREAVASARLVANPGCYPTAVQLGYKPLLENGLVSVEGLVADCKSWSQWRRSLVPVWPPCYVRQGTLFMPMVWTVTGICRKSPRGCQIMSAGQADNLTFVPHLLPMIRGIHATLYGQIAGCSGHQPGRTAISL